MPDAFHHEALFYADTDEFLGGTLPFLENALEAGEPAVVAVSQAKTAMLKGALGSDSVEIGFMDMEELGRNPARIIPFWRDFVDERGGSNGPVRGIGEPLWPGRTAIEIDECQRHEALLNLAFGGPPAWLLLCPYDSRALGDDVLDAARRCHPFVAADGTSEENSAWAASEASPAPFDGLLDARPERARTLEFDRRALHEVRSLVDREAGNRDLSAPRRSDLVTAASELAANSILHGGGHGTLAVWEDTGALLVQVEDAGWIDDRLAGRVRPDPTQVSGRGLWLANSLCDLVQIRSGAGGTAVRLHISLG